MMSKSVQGVLVTRAAYLFVPELLLRYVSTARCKHSNVQRLGARGDELVVQ